MSWTRGLLGGDGMRKNWLRLILPAGILLLLTGCLFRPPDDLYQLPERSAGYEQLNTVIRAVRSELEGKYNTSIDNAAIISGDNTATIQLQDLDGDGERESAVVFLRIPGIEKAIRIYLFTQIDDRYQVAGVVEGDGTAIYSVDYVDLNGSGRKELVVNWQISTGVYQVGAYTLDELTSPRKDVQKKEERHELTATELLLTGCNGSRLLDIDQDARTEIAVAVIDSAGMESYVEVYSWQDAAFVKSRTTLSHGVTALSRMRPNYLAGAYYTPALYVTSALPDGSKAIDVIAQRDGQLVNLALDEETGVSRNILLSSIEVSPTDINEDLVMELPFPSPLPTYGDPNAVNYWLINWSQYDAEGQCTTVMTTYHNVADAWYLVIPDSWKDKITISRNDVLSGSGQREVVFSLWKGEDAMPEPFLSIYRLTGNNRSSHANREGRFILREDRDVIYAARFYDWDCGLSEADLLNNFKTIQPSWNSD